MGMGVCLTYLPSIFTKKSNHNSQYPSSCVSKFALRVNITFTLHNPKKLHTTDMLSADSQFFILISMAGIPEQKQFCITSFARKRLPGLIPSCIAVIMNHNQEKTVFPVLEFHFHKRKITLNGIIKTGILFVVVLPAALVKRTFQFTEEDSSYALA